jgi:hypothetical protein
MLPDAEDAPPCPAQRSCHQNIARLVAGEFIFPERAVAFRLSSVLWTTMPETTVHKKREPDFWENEIRLAEDFSIPPPAGDFVPAKEFCQRDFRVLVSVRANARHDFGTLRFGENVRPLFCRSSFHLRLE